jgi:hypothetical protein
MPLIYGCVPGANVTSNATPNTANDFFFVKPGTRNVSIRTVGVQGKGASRTTISGIAYRCEKWTSTASSGGSAIVPTPRDPGFQPAKASAGFSASAVVSGTGGPSLCFFLGSSTTGPNRWIAPDLDSPATLEGSATQSLDLFNACGEASVAFEFDVDIAE